MSPTSRLRAGALALVTAAVLAVAGCTTGADDLGSIAQSTPAPTASAAPAPSAPADPAACPADGLASFAPDPAVTGPAAFPAGGDLARIRDAGSLRVGVSADTLLMGARNPLTGRIEGFDIDVLHEISRAIFGDPDRLTFVVITSADRLPALTPDASGTTAVDVVARTMTITCDRWNTIAFSTEYYSAGLKVLVRSGSEAAGIQQLTTEDRVCAPASTTTLARLADYPVTAVEAPTHSQCLALFQQGEVDAIAGDDTILAGFAAQDPYAKVIGERLSSEPYGLGMPLDDVDLVRFVNGVLDEMRADGRWEAIYQRWLGELGAATPPPAVYGR